MPIQALSVGCADSSPRGRAKSVGPATLSGEIAEAPPVAEEARRFRGSAPIGGHDSGRESVGTTVGSRRPLRSSIDRRCVGATLAVARPMTTAPPCKKPCHCEGAPRPWQSVIPYSPIPIFHPFHKNDSFYFCIGIGYTILRKILASRCKSGYNYIVNMWQYAVFSGETHL